MHPHQLQWWLLPSIIGACPQRLNGQAATVAIARQVEIERNRGNDSSNMAKRAVVET